MPEPQPIIDTNPNLAITTEATIIAPPAPEGA
jgi:hypothetical protein